MVKKEEILFHGTKTQSRGFTITLRHTTHSTRKRLTPMSPPGFEAAIPASEQPQTHALDRVATGIGKKEK